MDSFMETITIVNLGRANENKKGYKKYDQQNTKIRYTGDRIYTGKQRIMGLYFQIKGIPEKKIIIF